MSRSHPNKAVDVVAHQTLPINLGFSVINSSLFPSSRLTAILSASSAVGFEGVFLLGLTLVIRQPPPAPSLRTCPGVAAHIPLFFAFFPPLSQSRCPYRRKSVSGPNDPKIYCALLTRSLRTIVSPVLLIPNCGWISPESSCSVLTPDTA